jgi:hypothetical protein
LLGPVQNWRQRLLSVIIVPFALGFESLLF